jgi:hypothetical protein
MSEHHSKLVRCSMKDPEYCTIDVIQDDVVFLDRKLHPIFAFYISV